MKRTVKKTQPLSENSIEPEVTKGKTISIYLNAESLQHLNELCEHFKLGKGPMIQQMLLFNKQGTMWITPLLKDKNSPLAEWLKQIERGGEKANE